MKHVVLRFPPLKLLTTDARAVICAPGTASLAREARDMARKEGEEEMDVKVNTMKLFLSAKKLRSIFRNKVIYKFANFNCRFSAWAKGERGRSICSRFANFSKKISSSCFFHLWNPLQLAEQQSPSNIDPYRARDVEKEPVVVFWSSGTTGRQIKTLSRSIFPTKIIIQLIWIFRHPQGHHPLSHLRPALLLLHAGEDPERVADCKK